MKKNINVKCYLGKNEYILTKSLERTIPFEGIMNPSIVFDMVEELLNTLKVGNGETKGIIDRIITIWNGEEEIKMYIDDIDDLEFTEKGICTMPIYIRMKNESASTAHFELCVEFDAANLFIDMVEPLCANVQKFSGKVSDKQLKKQNFLKQTL